MPIYSEGIRRFFTYVVPLVFVSYLPAVTSWRADPLGLPPVLQLCSPIVAVLFLLVARSAGRWGCATTRARLLTPVVPPLPRTGEGLREGDTS